MIGFEIFLFGLLITSVITGLATEAVKSVLTEHNIKYRANTLAGLVALVVSAAIGSGYIILSGENFTTQVIICLLGLVFLSWLCAMVGYDKVMQAISQFKTYRKDDSE